MRLDGDIELIEGQKGLFRILDIAGQFRGHVVQGKTHEPYSWLVLIEGEKVPYHAQDFEESRKLAQQLIREQDSRTA